MNIKGFITFILALIILTSCNQPKSDKKSFVLKGTVDGPNTEYVVLSYTDSSDVYISDTLPVKNNSFFKQGSLIHPQLVSLTSNLTGDYMEDPNRLRFFLEPNEMEITLQEDQFPDALITGSKSQNEYELLAKEIKPYYEKVNLNVAQRKKLTEDNREEIEKSNIKIRKLFDEVKNIQLKYAINNPQSYVSAEVINFHSRQLPIDSLKMLYAGLDPILKDSFYGLAIHEEIKSYKFIPIVDSGDIAPNFTSENSDGNVLSLNQFKGKTVLLDFGAGWCVPCKEEIPEVKRIFDKYHSKGLEIIGISFDKDKTSWKENIKDEKLNWHHIYVGSDNIRENGSINVLYRVQPIPAYILIDENGIIIDRYRGADKKDKSLKDLEAKLETLLSSKLL
ncbi:TlpA disulfide reductase family protein [Winogradskyella sp. UBA3174]|uniref:TlpA disulfide reductase family protein n=1 Tax=Winogradskyella sp. UBA3174 TaxID=1947785 RepID=UPI0025FE042A|nr:TlpA disulfide reductase family protein [Winogradskyella sp. UBA3174]|tara:strand:- start:142 stop:1317 length:1176 start_codon:yes stop_codon:yes gene_type:complete